MRRADSTTVLIHRVMDCRAIVAVIRMHHSKADNTKGGEGCTLWTTKIPLYRMSQEKRSIFWETIISVILRKKVDMNMCPIPNGFRDRAI
jgi:hypothetical protein